MKLAIMQPYFLSYLNYYRLIRRADKFILLDDVNFIKGGWINRNRILVNGSEYLFTVPLKGSSPNKLINEINIIDNDRWKKKLLKTFELAYKRAPYFNEIFPLLEGMIAYKENNISLFIYNSIRTLLEFFELKTDLTFCSSGYANNRLKGEERVIDICTREHASEYINSIGGVYLYSREAFKAKGIALHFLENKDITYKQFDNEFIPGLSIVDVMMFNSRKEILSFLD
jgi:hypothetical protein